MISVYLLLLVPTVTLAGVEIVESPEAFTWIEQGEEKGLICTTNSGWQWCQWEHTTSDNEVVKYQIGQEFATLETVDPLISFTDMSETTCGIKITDADRAQHEVMCYYYG